MAISKDRKMELKILSLKLAASMIEDYTGLVTDPSVISITDDEAEFLNKENQKVAAKIYASAERLSKKLPS